MGSHLEFGGSSSANESAALRPPGGRFLSFSLGPDEYAVPIGSVQAVHAWARPTQIVSAPAHVAGVLDLHGVIAPAVDLRRVFRSPSTRHEPPVAIVALRVGVHVVGVVVDAVTGVVDLAPEQVLPVPDDATAGRSVGRQAPAADAVLGIGAVEERLLILIDLARVLAFADLGLEPGTVH